MKLKMLKNHLLQVIHLLRINQIILCLELKVD